MVVHDLDLIRIAVAPLETYAPLIVDADTVLPFPASRQLFQPIAGWAPQILLGLGCVEHEQFSTRDA